MVAILCRQCKIRGNYHNGKEKETLQFLFARLDGELFALVENVRYNRSHLTPLMLFGR